MQPRFLDQQQHGERDDAARQLHLAAAGKYSRGQHDQRGDLGGPVDVTAARRRIRDDHQRRRAADQQRREPLAAAGPLLAGQTTKQAKQRERPQAGKPRVLALGAPGPLALDADRRAAERADEQGTMVSIVIARLAYAKACQKAPETEVRGSPRSSAKVLIP